MTVAEARSRVSYWASWYGVPESIALAVAEQESGFNQNARGAQGEIGIMQIMPATAAGLGVDPYDPEQNIEGGVRLLRENYDRFGDWSLALSAYNGGPGAVVAYGGINPKTAGYVASVLNRAGRQPGAQTEYSDNSGVLDTTPSPPDSILASLPEHERLPLMVLAGLLLFSILLE